MNRLNLPPPKPLFEGLFNFIGILVLISAIHHVDPACSQNTADLVSPATPEMAIAQEFDIEGRSEIGRNTVYVDDSFQYTLILSWLGNQQWISLDPPEVSWPESVEQVDVRTKSISKAGSAGPVGEKSFIYELAVTAPGTVRLPDIQVEILFRDSSTQSVEIIGKEIAVSQRPTPASEKLISKLRKNGWIIGGVCLLLMAALGFYFGSKKRESRNEGEETDRWAPLEESLKRCEALQKAGQARDFYGLLESTLISACILYTGRTHRKFGDYCDDDSIPESVKTDLQSLVGEIEERKYRPDQPRPDEIQRAYKQARSALSSLKQLYQEKGP